MDWITTAGRTLDEAKSNALDQLGIVADEAEFDVVNDVEKGLFGRVKTEAKIRARVRPRQPVAKDEGRSRNGGGRNRSRSRGKGGGQSQGGNRKSSNNKSGNQNGNRNKSRNGNDSAKSGNRNNNGGGKSGQNDNRRGGQQQGQRKSEAATVAAAAGAGAAASKAKSSGKKESVEVEVTVSREEQETVAKGFLEGVLTTFGMTGTVAVVEEEADDGAIEMAVSGSELGLLVGQKGNTLSAVQELTRTVVQRNAEGAKTDRLRVDVAGYRARRAQALSDFAQGVAQEVVDSGSEKLLEPMGPADRKVVHDALTDFDGVETGSEGEEPRRRVVIRPV